jgi:hypothetical protein
MKTKRLNRSVFILSVLSSLTALYVAYGPNTQKVLTDLNFLIPATVFASCFVIIASLIIAFKRLQQKHSYNNAEIKFCVLQGLAGLPEDVLLANKESIKNIIKRKDDTPSIDPQIKARVKSLANSLEITLPDLI